MQMLGSVQEAEDATQSCFMKAWTSRATVQNEHSIRSWLYSIARNECLDRLRAYKRVSKLLAEYLFVNPVERSHTAPEIPLLPAFQIRVLALPKRQREIFLLRHLHQFSTEESAKLLNINAGTVKAHLKRAVDTLKKTFEAEGLVSTDSKSEPSVVVERELI